MEVKSMGREKWLLERKNGIGGSDAGAIIGVNPFMSNVDLWKIKTGRKEQKDISEKPAVKYGTLAEEYLRELFKLDFPEYEVLHEPFSIIKNKKYPFLFASLDGQLRDRRTGRKGIWECKTSEIRRASDLEKWNNQIPQSYYCQVLHYFGVDDDFDFALLKAQLKRKDMHGNLWLDTRHYFFERKDCQGDINYLQPKEVEFWEENVKKDIMPALILPTLL